MLNWLREKVTSRDTSSANPGSSGGGLGSPTGEASSSSYDSLSKDDADSFGSSGRSTLVVVRDAAVPKMTLDSNDLQLLRDIPEFKPLLHEGSGVSGAASIDTKALIQICKIYQSHMHTSAENISLEQNHLTARMKEIDATIKVLMERLQERQKAYARSADQLKKTPDITLSLKKMRYNIRETEEMLRQLNAQLPDDLKLEPFYFVDKPDSKTATEGCTGNKLT